MPLPWDRRDLEHVAGARLTKRRQLRPVEVAVLAYARWQGLTDEDGINVAEAKQSLDAALTALDVGEPDLKWDGLTALAQDLGDEAIIGLMKYSMARGLEQLQVQDHSPDEPTPALVPLHKKKRKDRDR